MTEPRGWGLPESHLLPDAVVAFVDGELSLGAQDRAASHVARCPGCAAEVTAQRQARAAVKRAEAPSMSDGFLASLRSIPLQTDIDDGPDNLAITEDGQLVAVQRPDRVAGLRPGAITGTAPLGSSASLGNSPNVLGRMPSSARRRAAQGAGVVVSGLVLSALALVATSSGGTTAQQPSAPSGPPSGVLRAQFGGQNVPATSTMPSGSRAPFAGAALVAGPGH
jgi:anti-sigma factor RsiW